MDENLTTNEFLKRLEDLGVPFPAYQEYLAAIHQEHAQTSCRQQKEAELAAIGQKINVDGLGDDDIVYYFPISLCFGFLYIWIKIYIPSPFQDYPPIL